MKCYALLFTTALMLSSAVHGQQAITAPPTTPDLHLAGTELIKSAKANNKSLLAAIGGGLLTVLVATQADKEQLAPVMALGGLTAVATLGFNISAISHKRKAGQALRPTP